MIQLETKEQQDMILFLLNSAQVKGVEDMKKVIELHNKVKFAVIEETLDETKKLLKP